MTTRNVRLSDGDIDRLLDWGESIYEGLEHRWERADSALRDRLVEAKLSTEEPGER